MQRNSILVAALIIFSILISILPAQSAGQDITPEAYRVYSVVLRAEYDADDLKTIVIIKTTSPNRLGLPGSTGDGDIVRKHLSEESLYDYDAQNTKRHELSDRFDIKAKVILVNEKEIEGIFIFKQRLEKSWESFYKRFPDSWGYVWLSGVGFNESRNEAVVFVSHYCGVDCASGTYYVLVKEKEEWKIKRSEWVWAS